MQKYEDTYKDSRVECFQNQATSIKVRFKDSYKVFVYTYEKPGRLHVERMKRLALSGDGLNTFVNKYVEKNYDHIE